MDTVVEQIVRELKLAIRTEEYRELTAGKNGEWAKADRHSTERQALTKFHGEVRRILKPGGEQPMTLTRMELASERGACDRCGKALEMSRTIDQDGNVDYYDCDCA